MNTTNTAANTNSARDRRTYGAKYDRGLSTAEIAKRVREDIKAGIEAGTLPRGLKTFGAQA